MVNHLDKRRRLKLPRNGVVFPNVSSRSQSVRVRVFLMEMADRVRQRRLLGAIRVWDERYEREYGYWRPVVRHVVNQFLDCGDLRCGFARLWCPSCRKDLLLPYSSRRRCACPSCHQKRALQFAEHVN